MQMEKCRSFSHYSSRFDFKDEPDPYAFNGPNSKSLDDPELKRKKRIASYNSFNEASTVQARLESLFTRSKESEPTSLAMGNNTNLPYQGTNQTVASLYNK
ncbi:Protein of unknown function (DUF3511 [Striga hermonthica]|uniref:Uncharacterized protein n=1 Tax=Striga hermonthica TaxID=68872 RepID=A0A9N7R338_STRHE|nr:Protein of unknown function (DUF3511 [Striga hermonthica]